MARSNKTKPVRTPGGRLTPQILKKRVKAPHCAVCKQPLQGLKQVATAQWKNLKQRERRVSRAYGGSVCASCVKDKITRAFLLEEQKLLRNFWLNVKVLRSDFSFLF